MKDKLPQTLEELPIKLFKLMNGESIISYTHDLNDYSVGLEEPMNIKLNSDYEYILTPWVPFSEGRVHILDNMNIIIDSPVDSTMKAQYMRIVLDNIEDSGDIALKDTILH